MNKEKYLVINADDFGIDEGINRGIGECLERGVVRSVSLVSNGAAFQNAINLIRKVPDIGVGVHVCLVGEKALLAKKEVPSLVDKNGFLFYDYRYFILKLLSRRINLVEIEKEIDAQIRKVLDCSIAPTHLDSHQYIHLIPSIFNIVVKLAKKYNIRWLRNPYRIEHVFLKSCQNRMKKMCLNFLSRYNLQVLRNSGILYPEFSYGIMSSGNLSERVLVKLLKEVTHGIVDIVCHPGYNPHDRRYYQWQYKWEEEKKVLLSESLYDVIKKCNLRIINYAFRKS